MKAYIFICPECGRQSMDDNYCEDCNVGGGFDEFIPATGHAELLEALQAIAAEQPTRVTYHGNLSCFYCGADVIERDEPHNNDCAWMKAKEAIAKVTPTCNHSWIVFSTAVATGQIMVECSVCKATGTVDTHTRAEWQAAFHAPSNPYRWDGGDDRITVTGATA